MYISKRFIIISCVLLFIVSPAAAAILVNVTHKDAVLSSEVQPATKKELLSAIKQANDNPAASQQFEEVTDIVSIKRMDTWWYVATVKLAGNSSDDNYNPGLQGMIFAKFTNQPNSIYVVTKPGEAFNHYNISGSAGVPYDVIDELNGVNNSDV